MLKWNIVTELLFMGWIVSLKEPLELPSLSICGCDLFHKQKLCKCDSVKMTSYWDRMILSPMTEKDTGDRKAGRDLSDSLTNYVTLGISMSHEKGQKDSFFHGVYRNQVCRCFDQECLVFRNAEE